MRTLDRRVSGSGCYWLVWGVLQTDLAVVPLTQNSIDVVLRQTGSGSQIAPVSESAVCKSIHQPMALEYVAVVTWPQPLTSSVYLTAQRAERHDVNMVALVRDSVYRCRNPALMRWTCCYRGDVVEVDRFCSLRVGQKATALGFGRIEVGNVWARVGAFDVDQTLVEGAHDRGGLQ